MNIFFAPALLTLALLAACEPAAPPEPPKPTLDDTLAAAPAERVFKGVLQGAQVHLVVHDCKAWRAVHSTDGKPAWEKILEPEPYPFFTGCDRQSLVVDKGTVTISLGRMAFGAGGCCATSGTWRSNDGVVWKAI